MPQDHKQSAKMTTRNGTLPFYNTTRFETTSTGTDTTGRWGIYNMQRYPYAYLVGAKGEAASQYIYTSITDNGQDRRSILYVYLLSLCLCTLRFCCVVLCAATPLHKRPLKKFADKRQHKKKLENIGFVRLRDVFSLPTLSDLSL